MTRCFRAETVAKSWQTDTPPVTES